MSDEKETPQGKVVEMQARVTGYSSAIANATVEKSGSWPRLTFDEKAEALRRGDQPLDLWEKTREKWPAMGEAERLAALQALEVPLDLWIKIVTTPASYLPLGAGAGDESEEIRQTATRLLYLVKPTQVIRPAPIVSESEVFPPTVSSTNYTLKAETGSFALSGQDAALTVTPAIQLPIKVELPPALPEALTGDVLSVPNALAYYDARKALAQPEMFTRTDAEPWPTATFQHADSSTRVQMKPTSADKAIALDAELALIRQMWEQHGLLSDTDADTLDALMAIYLERNTATGDAAAHIDNVLGLRGLQRKKAGSGRRGGFRQEQREEALASVFRLESLWIEFAGPIVTQRGKKPVRDVIRSRAISVTDVYGQRRLDDGRLDALSFSYRPGKAFAHFLHSEGGRQTALLSAKALKYDPYRQPYEKRLARYFAYIWRVRASKSEFYQPFRVEALLQESGFEIDRERPKRMKTRLEAALDLLETDGVIAAWQYCQDTDTDRRGWLTDWLKAGVRIDAPDVIRDHLKTIDHRNRPALTEGTLAARFADARKLADLSQSYAADRLGIEPARLDAIENGREKITPALARRLEDMLAELPQPTEPE